MEADNEAVAARVGSLMVDQRHVDETAEPSEAVRHCVYNTQTPY